MTHGPHSRNQTDKFGNQKIIRQIKRTRQDSKHIIILVIFLEHRRKPNAKFQGNP